MLSEQTGLRAGFCVIFIMAALFTLTMLALETAEAEQHEPIYINGNEGFGNPNNGVSNYDDTSAGTEDNPYIIENWEIIASTAIIGQGGIHIENTDVHFIIRDCELHNGTPAEKIGIYFSNVENGKIEDTTCWDNKYGIRIHASSDILIDSCDIRDNYGYHSGHGIYFSSSSDNRITACELHNNSGFGAGFANGYGILIESSSDIMIDSCFIHNNERDGIRSISDSPRISIESCELYLNYHGIDLEDSPHSTIRNCTSYGNGFAGMLLYTDSNECQITDCTFYDNGWHGLFLKECSNNRLENCVSYGNEAGSGIILDSSGNELVDCTCYGNHGQGIYLVGSSDNRLEYCTSYENDYGGIVLHTSDDNEITHCDVYGNDYYGLSLYWEAYNNIVTYNRASDNERGIHLSGNSGNNQIFLNDFIDNEENVQSDGTVNIWNSPEQMAYTYNGETHTNYMGNYWSDYSGEDYDDDGIGDTPYTSTIIDLFPLMEEWEHYFNRLPVVEITEPDQGEEISGVCTIEGTASDEDGDEQIENVEIRVDDGDWIEAEGTTDWSYEWNTRDVEDGEHTIQARAFDGADHSDIAETDVSVNNGGPVNHLPTIEISAPESGSAVEGMVTIEGVADDEDGDEHIENVEIRIDDDGDWMEAEGTTGWTFEWDTLEVENGNHTIHARAFDGADYSVIFTMGVTVNNTQGTHGQSDDDDDGIFESTTTLLSIIGACAALVVVGVVLFVKKREERSSEGMRTCSRSGWTRSVRQGRMRAEHSARRKHDRSAEGPWTMTTGERESGQEMPSSTGAREKVRRSRGPTRVKCPRCSVAIIVRNPERPLKIACPRCDTRMVLKGKTGTASGGSAGSAKSARNVEDSPDRGAEDTVACPGCGGETQYSEEDEDYYCWECQEYIGEMQE